MMVATDVHTKWTMGLASLSKQRMKHWIELQLVGQAHQDFYDSASLICYYIPLYIKILLVPVNNQCVIHVASSLNSADLRYYNSPL